MTPQPEIEIGSTWRNRAGYYWTVAKIIGEEVYLEGADPELLPRDNHCTTSQCLLANYTPEP